MESQAAIVCPIRKSMEKGWWQRIAGKKITVQKEAGKVWADKRISNFYFNSYLADNKIY